MCFLHACCCSVVSFVGCEMVSHCIPDAITLIFFPMEGDLPPPPPSPSPSLNFQNCLWARCLLKLHLPELKSQHCHIPPFVVHLGEAGGATIQGHKLIEFLCVCNEQNYLLPSNCNRCAMQVNKPQGISMYQPGSSPESSSSVNSGFTVAFSCDFRDRATTFSP